MYETHVTVVGRVADSPRRSNLSSGAVTNFRMASTVRRYDAASQGFVDGRTLWVDVECWGNLSSNVSASISKGDPVIVHGQLITSEWESENGRRSKNCIKASAVGPNLDRGRALFTKDPARRSSEVPENGDESAPPEDGGAPGDDLSASDDDLLAGRDYEVEGEALDLEDADLPREPAHA